MSVGEPAVTTTCTRAHRGGPQPASVVMTFECKTGHERQSDIPLCRYCAEGIRAGLIHCLGHGGWPDAKKYRLVVVEEHPL